MRRVLVVLILFAAISTAAYVHHRRSAMDRIVLVDLTATCVFAGGPYWSASNDGLAAVVNGPTPLNAVGVSVGHGRCQGWFYCNDDTVTFDRVQPFLAMGPEIHHGSDITDINLTNFTAFNPAISKGFYTYPEFGVAFNRYIIKFRHFTASGEQVIRNTNGRVVPHTMTVDVLAGTTLKWSDPVPIGVPYPKHNDEPVRPPKPNFAALAIMDTSEYNKPP